MATATALDKAVHMTADLFPNRTPPLIPASSDRPSLQNAGTAVPGLPSEARESEARLWDIIPQNASTFAVNQLPNSMPPQQLHQQQTMKTDHTPTYIMGSSPQHQQQNGSLPPQLQAAMLSMNAVPVQNFPPQMLQQQQTRFARPPRLPCGGNFAQPPSQPGFVGPSAAIQCPPHAVLFPNSAGFGGAPPPPRDYEHGRSGPMKLSPQANQMQSSPHVNMPRPTLPQQQYSGPYQQVIAPPMPSQIMMSPCRSPIPGQSVLFPNSVVGQPSLRMQMAPPQMLPHGPLHGVDIFSQMSPQHAVQRSVGGRSGVPIVGSVSQPQLMHHHDGSLERERLISANMANLRMQVRGAASRNTFHASVIFHIILKTFFKNLFIYFY